MGATEVAPILAALWSIQESKTASTLTGTLERSAFQKWLKIMVNQQIVN